MPKPVHLLHTLAALIFLIPACEIGSRDLSPAGGISNRSQTESPENSQININSASAEDLQRLPGVGPGLAERIVEHRRRFGPFRRPEHLMLVDGIGKERFDRLRKYVRVE